MSALRDALRDLSEDVFFDLLESDDAYLLVVDVPGVTAESIDLTIEDGTLSIDARRVKDRDVPDEYQYIEENRSLFFDVTLPIPKDAIPGNAETAVERGVLELTLPKRGGGETKIEVVDDADVDSSATGARDEGGDEGNGGATQDADMDADGGTETDNSDETTDDAEPR
ncbi:heat-shock protein Hsp20 [Halobiforma lacisalsi AJ5]|uniref:Heat-shock protein Hsp20 n=1 Tax=Natronobacterium lacisalsi AJ5 TaxID=358396 RepID=M0LYT2_NATLA|nr:Hsp20/alpha crystallin family protein [Halobiforma lacisalsi]APW97766.1 heat-shock protein Hsp20 [Halobiforma lacisalsi AJ5]EMA37489.1 heat shock protein Hsp20 [Halobiforma lacisalsi AJ5]